MAATGDDATSSHDKPNNLTEIIAQHIRESVIQHYTSSLNSRKSKTPIVGIQGPQGSGKTTTAKAVKALIEDSDGWNIVLLSLDDLYLTHDGLRSVATAHPSNALLNGRGHPGTHDLELGKEILDRLQESNIRATDAEDELTLPVFDKSLYNGEGDRLPEGSWVKIEGSPELVIVEGWCLGFYPLSDKELEKRYEAIRHQTDGSNAETRQPYTLQDLKDINGYLKSYAETLYHFFTCFAQIAPGPDPIALTYKWRLEQEHDMKARNGGRGMTDEQVNAFVDRYIPGYLFFSDGVEKGYNTESGVEPVPEKYPPWRGRHLRVTIDENRTVTKVEKM